MECGNLQSAKRIIGREKLINNNFSVVPSEVIQEYDLVLRNDINTNGNIQWYYFSTKIGNKNESIDSNEDNSRDGGENLNDILNDSSDSMDELTKKISYPCKIRFNIVNFQKNDSQYCYGLKPTVCYYYYYYYYLLLLLLFYY
jgi:hypothetical protein